MNDAFLMSIIQCKADLDNDRYRISPVKVTILVDKILNGNAFNVLLYNITELTFVSKLPAKLLMPKL